MTGKLIKHSLIIGGTRGLGRALVRLWSDRREGYVSVLGLRPPSPEDRRLPQVGYWRADLRKGGEVTSLIQRIIRERGPLSSLVFYQRFRGAPNDWGGEFQVSLTATKEIIERTVDYFHPTGEKSVVIIGSVASRFIATEQSVGYHVAKAGLSQLVRYYAVNLGPRKIRVNAVSPGPVLKDESMEFYKKHKKFRAFYKSVVPLGRMGTMEEIAGAVDFLCSPNASFITGQDLVVDGGLSIQGQESLARHMTSMRTVKVTRK